jgi:hypothetical protein
VGTLRREPFTLSLDACCQLRGLIAVVALRRPKKLGEYTGIASDWTGAAMIEGPERLIAIPSLSVEIRLGGLYPA